MSKVFLVFVLETRGMLVGTVLCLLGFVLLVYGLVSMTAANALSNSSLVVVGIFLGIAGLLVFMMSAFGGSIFS